MKHFYFTGMQPYTLSRIIQAKLLRPVGLLISGLLLESQKVFNTCLLYSIHIDYLNQYFIDNNILIICKCCDPESVLLFQGLMFKSSEELVYVLIIHKQRNCEKLQYTLAMKREGFIVFYIFKIQKHMTIDG